VTSPLRNLPAVHHLLERPALRSACDEFGHDAVTAACRTAVADLRRRIVDQHLADPAIADGSDGLEAVILQHLYHTARDAYPAVINATGVLLHTNLGRAPLATSPGSLSSYLALEFDLESGGRGQRLAPVADRIARVCGAEAAVMVNNNAAALFLILAGLARGGGVAVSRSQLIEIGGSFRLPDVMAASGARLVEVGCTNRTHLADFEHASDDGISAILVVHQSNFRIVGFTTFPPLAELANLAHDRGLPLIVDQGSGCLHDLGRWGLPHESTVSEILEAGADVVCFSGDKLLGGPQAGLIVGRDEWVRPLGGHPLYRALRPDKHALVRMDRTLAAHQFDRLEEIPLYAMLQVPLRRLQRRARRIRRLLDRDGIAIRSRATRAAVGGGTTPDETIPSWGLTIAGGLTTLDRLRAAEPPIIGRIENDEVILDLRTVLPVQDEKVVTALRALYNGSSARQASGA
jgi:L-seryl-tRNA(Ser) seleniumtransferase